MTPYEFFCEEFNAGIPTWAVGRKFEKGQDVPEGDGLRMPEVRLPLLLGIFGSAFCATLNLYYKEVRPIIKGLAGFGGIDEMIQGRNDDLSKVHPIDPASIPNPFIGMREELPPTTPESMSMNEHLQLMDAGMSNNLPICSSSCDRYSDLGLLLARPFITSRSCG
jgi:phospholipase A2